MNKKNYIYGLHAVTALLQAQPERVVRLFVQKTREDQKIHFILRLAQKAQIPIEQALRQQLDKLAPHANHQGVIAYATMVEAYSEADLERLIKPAATQPLVLVLDEVQDPHNLGACFRTADAAGVTAIIVPKDKSVSITPAVTKVASGATQTVPFIQATNLVRALEKLKELGLWIYGAEGEASQSIYQTQFASATALVMGAEGKGLRRLTREHCDQLISIPLYGSVESLNVSVATGICLFEVARQRFFKNQ